MLPLLLVLTLIEHGWSDNLPNAQLYNHRSNGSPTGKLNATELALRRSALIWQESGLIDLDNIMATPHLSNFRRLRSKRAKIELTR
ncbi:hypothetical protein D918_04366 [Trichuris suis]|nr:hypothetical protein D918_04366 [Trichuris suis]